MALPLPQFHTSDSSAAVDALAMRRRHEGRRKARAELPDAAGLRTLAAEIRQHTLDHLDHYLEQLQSAIERQGGHTHFAQNPAEARRIITEIAQKSGCARCVSDTSPATEDLKLPPMHDAEPADLRVTGASFLVAETGIACVIGDRVVATPPRVLVALAGIEQVVPRMADLAVMLKLFSAGNSGHSKSVYTTLFGPPPRDAGQTFHVILLDNGRSDILAGSQREVLRCIRCGACVDACPVYRTIGGQAGGNYFGGPVGAILAPLLHGLDAYHELPQASTLCGECADVCPVKIDLPRHLLQLRQRIVAEKVGTWRERLRYRLWAWVLKSPRRYRWLTAIMRWRLRKRAVDGWVSAAPGATRTWTQTRDLPAPATKTFRQLWSQRRR